MRSIWMHAWDLAGFDPAEVAAFLKSCGLSACNLAFSYHGGRMLLPRNRRRVVYELDPGALYFPAELRRYHGLRLKPHVAPEAALVPPFVEACRSAGLAVYAWTVLCHNDGLGAAAPECCVMNAFGERYSYALCPSNPEVRRYVIALCRDVAAFPGLSGLELEALSFLGLEHNSLHDKLGVPLSSAISWLLSLCFCEHCCKAMGEAAGEIAARARSTVRRYFAEPAAWELQEVLGREALAGVLAARRRVLTTLLDDIRAAAGRMHLNLRVAGSPLFCGGKAALEWPDLAGRVDSATVTFFGYSKQRMAAELESLPARAARPAPLYGGFVFHHPDCASEADFRERLGLVRAAELDGVLVYCYGLAAEKHFQWLRDAFWEGN